MAGISTMDYHAPEASSIRLVMVLSGARRQVGAVTRFTAPIQRSGIRFSAASPRTRSSLPAYSTNRMTLSAAARWRVMKPIASDSLPPS